MKKKGFTLIELLAVIVILGVIALIAAPIILKNIEHSEREALKNNIISIDRAILMRGTLNRKDKEYTSVDELKMEINELEMKVSYVDGINKFYKMENEIYKLDVSRCKAKEYCTIGEVKNIENIIVKKEVIYYTVKDSNPGIICGEGPTEDVSLSTCYIKSIEDLVGLATLVNKGTTFKDKTVELVNNLDFKNKKSYASKKVDDNLTSGVGFQPIGFGKKFQGTFNGNNKTIRHLYINRPTNYNVGLFGNLSSGVIKNLALVDADVSGNRYTGGLVGNNNLGVIENVSLNSVKVTASGPFCGGVIGENNGSISNIKLKKINFSGTAYSGGIVGNHTKNSVLKKVVGEDIYVKGQTQLGAAVGSNYSTVTQIKLNNISVEGSQSLGGLVGWNVSGGVSHSKVEGDINGSLTLGLAVGDLSAGTVNNVVVKGNIESNNINVGGLVGRANASSQETVANISGVYLSGSLNCADNSYNNIAVGYTGSYTPVLNTLVSSSITIKGNPAQSTDATSKDGKALDNMGQVSQSEYEALGFEFMSTDTNESYWHFDENDEIDLIIK